MCWWAMMQVARSIYLYGWLQGHSKMVTETNTVKNSLKPAVTENNITTDVQKNPVTVGTNL